MRAILSLSLSSLSVSLLVIAGCARQPDADIGPSPQTNASVLDFSPQASQQQSYQAYQPAPQPQVIQVPQAEHEAPALIAPAPAASEPVANAPLVTQTPAPAPAAPEASGHSHTIRRGDTLYSLAVQYYGDGKQWEKIAAANRNLNPNALPVGQTLVIP